MYRSETLMPIQIAKTCLENQLILMIRSGTNRKKVETEKGGNRKKAEEAS